MEEAATVGLTTATVKIPTMTPQHRTLMVNGEVLKTPTIAVRTVDLRTVDMGTNNDSYNASYDDGYDQNFGGYEGALSTN